MNFNGWWYLLTLIPYVGFVMIFIIMLSPGMKEPNKFGTQSDKASKLEYILTFVFIFLYISLILGIFLIMPTLKTYLKN